MFNNPPRWQMSGSPSPLNKYQATILVHFLMKQLIFHKGPQPPIRKIFAFRQAPSWVRQSRDKAAAKSFKTFSESKTRCVFLEGDALIVGAGWGWDRTWPVLQSPDTTMPLVTPGWGARPERTVQVPQGPWWKRVSDEGKCLLETELGALRTSGPPVGSLIDVHVFNSTSEPGKLGQGCAGGWQVMRWTGTCVARVGAPSWVPGHQTRGTAEWGAWGEENGKT